MLGSSISDQEEQIESYSCLILILSRVPSSTAPMNGVFCTPELAVSHQAGHRWSHLCVDNFRKGRTNGTE